MTLWADRIQEEADRATRLATTIGRQGVEDLGALRWSLKTADEASLADAERRLGIGTVTVQGWPRRLRRWLFRG